MRMSGKQTRKENAADLPPTTGTKSPETAFSTPEQNLRKRHFHHRNALLLGAICFLAYAAVYAGKGLLGAVLPQLTESGSPLGGVAGSMGSVFLLTYGIGQLTNGLLGDRISAKYMVSFGLAVGGGILLCLPYLTSPLLAVLLWGICGFCCSMLWGPITATVGENTEERIAPVILTALTVASVFGGLVASFFALCSAAAKDWKVAFALAGAVMLMSAALWLFFYITMEKRGAIHPRRDRKSGSVGAQDPGVPKSALRQILYPGFFAAAVLTMCNGVLRNATALWISTWMYRSLGFSVESATGISAILPVLTIAATFASLWLLKPAKGREKPVCAWLGAIQTACFAVVALIGTSLPWLSVAALFLAMACALGICNLIFSKYLLRYRFCGRLSGISGFFDFASYLSAAVSNLWFTALADAGAWGSVLWLWTAFSLASFLAASVSLRAREADENRR